MDVIGWNVEPQRLESTLSLTDLRAKLFPVDKLDRAPVLSEDKYTPRTLVGNWFERRAVHTPELVQWKTTYDVDYIPHVNKSWKENQLIKWDNMLDLEVYERRIL